jgi:pyruvate dehydrogenase E2 component (dihydrolipoamide acetyltransferase)
MRDSLEVLRPAYGAYQITIDMSAAMQRLDGLRRERIAATPTHLLVRAAARALAANPDLHALVSGTRRARFGRVDIGVSVSGEIFVAPVVIIEGADRKEVPDIVAEMAARVPEVQRLDAAALKGLRRWGRLVPFGFLRRAMLRTLFSRPSYRRRVAGTFQISTVPVDWAATSTFVAAGVLVAGRVRSGVGVRDGQPIVQPMMTLTLSGDHGVWDGRAASRFLAAVKAEMEREV